ncbi:MAG: hypothetical protein H6Q59_1935 [Firmicutes bacterium]|nr:hypothetical protein [Bacillota bacterium]
MTYKEAREYIDQANQYGNELSLEAITELLLRLDNPQDKVKVIHVAGTNGKGSTTAFITSILASEGYKVGRYISPAVFTYRERIQITQKQNEYITEQGVSDTMEVIKTTCEAMVRDGLSHPTSFELETAMAFLYFAWQEVDFAVVEVGLGGRLDATNVMKKPACCVITSISMDHMQYLGDTLGSIAKEKAGIIKHGVPVVTCNNAPEVLTVVETCCNEQEASLYSIDVEKAEICGNSVEGTAFLYQGEKYKIKLLGEHQITNAIMAIQVAAVLRKEGYRISTASVQNGLEEAYWSGRFEVIGTKPYFIIDGAHNEDAAAKLSRALDEYFQTQRLIYIMGIFADKDYHKVLELTAPKASIILTITPNNSRALPSSQLALEAQKYCPAVIDAKTAEQAVQLAYEKASAEDVIIAFGSLSFLGEVKSLVTTVQD